MLAVLIRRATEGDISTVVNLWNEASDWLRQRGSDQWQYPVRVPAIRQTIHAGTCWVVESPDDGAPVATITLNGDADVRLWPPSDNPDDALYVHRLVVTRQSAGQGLGSALLDWAGAQAEAAGKAWLRLDVWTANTALQQYYLQHGFRLVRIVTTPLEVQSGALFERPAHTRHQTSITIHQATHHVPTWRGGVQPHES